MAMRLLLAAREHHAALADIGVRSPWEGLRESRAPPAARAAPAPPPPASISGVARVGGAKKRMFSARPWPGEDHRVLRHEGDRLAEIGNGGGSSGRARRWSRGLPRGR